MKKVTFLVIACFLFSIPKLAICADWTGNLNVLLGSKVLDEDQWEPADEQSEFGIEVDFKKQSWPVSIAIDFLSASGEGTLWGIKAESETSELNVGVRKIWDKSPHVRPFIGGGIAFITGEFSAFGLSEDDSATGFWIGGGVYWTLAEHFNIGLEAKSSSANVTLFGVEADAGGGHFGVLAGFHW